MQRRDFLTTVLAGTGATFLRLGSVEAQKPTREVILERAAATAKTRGANATPLAAYPGWCAFATALSTHIWLLNRR